MLFLYFFACVHFPIAIGSALVPPGRPRGAPGRAPGRPGGALRAQSGQRGMSVRLILPQSLSSLSFSEIFLIFENILEYFLLFSAHVRFSIAIGSALALPGRSRTLPKRSQDGPGRAPGRHGGGSKAHSGQRGTAVRHTWAKSLSKLALFELFLFFWQIFFNFCVAFQYFL